MVTNMPSNNKIVIVGGGNLGTWAINEIATADITIGADSGALFLIRNGTRPDYAVGDFDSVTAEERQEIAENSQFFQSCDPVMKNYTDMELAFQKALELQPAEIALVGATGTRFDHTLANVHLLAKALNERIPCRLIDEHNLIMATDNRLRIAQQDYPYISLLPLSEQVTGITLTGFQYPLTNASLTIGQSLGISNALTAEQGQITVGSGKLLVIASKE